MPVEALSPIVETPPPVKRRAGEPQGVPGGFSLAMASSALEARAGQALKTHGATQGDAAQGRTVANPEAGRRETGTRGQDA